MRRWLIHLANVILLGVVGVFVWRAATRHWDALAGTDIPIVDIHVAWILAAAATTWLTYLLLIAAWRLVLRGWGQQLAYRSAIRIWCLSNLGRYLPGKVWAIAGMAIMAKRHGVDGWAAGASALVMQVLAVTTGATIVIATLPLLGGGQRTLHPLFIGLAIVAGIVGLTLLTMPRFTSAVRQFTNGRFAPQPLALSAVAAGAGSTLLSWFAYGIAFWFLARGLLPEAVPGLLTATGSFAAGYVVGLIAVFVPGGIGVREGVLFALIAPHVGGPPALVLVTASRLLLTVTEASAALVALLLPGSTPPLGIGVSEESTN